MSFATTWLSEPARPLPMGPAALVPVLPPASIEEWLWWIGARFPVPWYLLPAAATLIALAGFVLLWMTRPRRSPGRRSSAPRAGATGHTAIVAETDRPASRRRRSRRRKAALLLGSLPGLSLTWLVLLGWSVTRGKAFNPHKPFWWVMAESGRPGLSGDVIEGEGLIEEIGRRLGAGELSDRQIGAVIRRTLLYQIDPGRSDAWYWGNLVEQARSMGDVPDDQWKQYLQQGLSGFVELCVRERVRRGDPLPVSLRPTLPPRLGRGLRVTWDFDQTVLVCGRAVGRPAPHTWTFDWRDKSPGWSVGIDPSLLSQLRDGPQTAQVSVLVKAYDSSSATTPACVVSVTPGAPWNLQPASVATIEPVGPPPPLGGVPHVEIRRTGAFPDEFEIDLAFRSGDPMQRHMGLAFDMFLRVGGEEWKVGSGATSDIQSDLRWLKRLPEFDAALPRGAFRADVILRPNPDAAVRSVGCTRYWDAEVMVPQVGVPF